MKRTSVATILLCMAVVSACSNPLPFGPGRVEVALERAAVQRVTRGVLLPESDPEWRDRPTNVIRFDLSSKTNLVRYFDDWDRLAQTRCFVYGAEDGRSYTGFAVGPLQEGVDVSMRGTRAKEAIHFAPDSVGKYQYTIYAFLDLTADDEKYVDGKPRGTFDLASQRFNSVGCFVIGVTKAPVLFPKTNTFYLDEREVKDGISNLAAEAARQTPLGSRPAPPDLDLRSLEGMTKPELVHALGYPTYCGDDGDKECRLTPRWSARVRDIVPSSYSSARSAQLNR